MSKNLPWHAWDEGSFITDPFVSRMKPASRSHLRTLIISSLAGPSPWISDDNDDLATLADCDCTEDWLPRRDAILRAFVTNGEDDTLIAHPMALQISEERAARAARGRSAANSRYPAKVEAEAKAATATNSALLLAARVLEVRFTEMPADIDEYAGILNPLTAAHGYNEVRAVAEWLNESAEAENFYRKKQFANCATPKAVLTSFVKSFDKLLVDSKKKPASSTKMDDIDAEAMLTKHSGSRA
jgi:hypothetical protein